MWVHTLYLQGEWKKKKSPLTHFLYDWLEVRLQKIIPVKKSENMDTGCLEYWQKYFEVGRSVTIYLCTHRNLSLLCTRYTLFLNEHTTVPVCRMHTLHPLSLHKPQTCTICQAHTSPSIFTYTTQPQSLEHTLHPLPLHIPQNPKSLSSTDLTLYLYIYHTAPVSLKHTLHPLSLHIPYSPNLWSTHLTLYLYIYHTIPVSLKHTHYPLSLKTSCL